MKRKRKTRKKVLLTSVFTVVVIVVAVTVLYQSPEEKPRPTAEEYFKISDVTYEGFIEDDGRLLSLHKLKFNLTTVGGDAHYVIVQNLGVDPESEWRPDYIELGTMLQGEVRTVSLTTEYGVHLHLEEKGFAVRVRVTSEETSGVPQDQFITTYVTGEEKVG